MIAQISSFQFLRIFRDHFVMLLSASPMHNLEDPHTILFCMYPTQRTVVPLATPYQHSTLALGMSYGSHGDVQGKSVHPHIC